MKEQLRILAFKSLLLFVVLQVQSIAAISQEDRDLLLKLHNEDRRRVAIGFKQHEKAANMLEMVYDLDVEKEAQRHASRCVYKHNRAYLRANGIGENIAQGIWRVFTAKRLYKAWFNEEVDYTYKTMQCKPGKKCGHYTQIVWARSYKLGCGVAKCYNERYRDYVRYLVCNYKPPGNYRGMHPYKTGKTCSACPKTHPNCRAGLCSNRGTLPIPNFTTTTVITTTVNNLIKMTQKDRDMILELHNNDRRQIAKGFGGWSKQPPASNMLEMVYDMKLEEQAQSHANKCKYRNDISYMYKYGAGQNVGMGSLDLEGMYGFWFVQSYHYNFYQKTRPRKTDDYVQIVWAKSYKLGCAMAKCNRYLFLVCNYWPRHHFLGSQLPQQPYKVGKACSACLGNTKKCNDGLCPVKEIKKKDDKERANWIKDVDCYTGEGKNYRGFKNTTENELTCQQWSVSYPHNVYCKIKGNTLIDKSKQAAKNYCRNPDISFQLSTQPFCYTTNPRIQRMNCGIPKCD